MYNVCTSEHAQKNVYQQHVYTLVFIVSYTHSPLHTHTHTHRCHHSAVEETTSWTPSLSVSSTLKSWELKRGMLHGDSSSGRRSLLPGTTLQMILLVLTSYTSRWFVVSSLESTAVIKFVHVCCTVVDMYEIHIVLIFVESSFLVPFCCVPILCLKWVCPSSTFMECLWVSCVCYSLLLSAVEWGLVWAWLWLPSLLHCTAVTPSNTHSFGHHTFTHACLHLYVLSTICYGRSKKYCQTSTISTPTLRDSSSFTSPCTSIHTEWGPGSTGSTTVLCGAGCTDEPRPSHENAPHCHTRLLSGRTCYGRQVEEHGHLVL